MRLFPPLACALPLLVACSGEVSPPAPASPPVVDRVAVIAGVADPGADPAVVLLDASPGLCTGALVAADGVLAPRRCLDGRAPSAVHVFVGDVVASVRERARGREVRVAAGEDAALLWLDATIDDVDPIAVRATSAALGDRLRTVAFDAFGKRVRDHVPVVGASDAAFLVEEVPCAVGGGIAIDPASGALVGVASYGGGGRDVYVRSDGAVAALLQELGPRARSTRSAAKEKKGPVDMGASCMHGADCAAGACVHYAGAQYCSRTCDAHDACPATWRCVASSGGPMVCTER